MVDIVSGTTITTAAITGAAASADSGTLSVNGVLAGDATLSGFPVFSGSGAINLGSVTIDAGTSFTLNSSLTINVSGDWTNNGTFNAGTTTITLNGTNQEISGTNTFYALSKTASSACTLTFPAGATTTVTNSLTLQGGDIDATLFLRSSTTGTAAKLTLSTGGSQSLQYLDVKDNDASGGLELTAYNSTDAGNNTNWLFVWTGDITAGLEGHWKLDNDATDASGNGNTGTASGVTFSTSNLPVVPSGTTHAASFDGSNDYISVTNTSLSLTTNISISLWIKNTDDFSSDSYSNYIISKGVIGSSPWNNYVMTMGSNYKYRFAIHTNQGSYGATTTSTFNDSNWHHVVGIYDYNNSAIKIYVDNALEKSTSAQGTINNTRSTFYIGDWNGNSTWHFWHGLIDDIRVYNRALSAGEVAILAAGSVGTGILTLKDTSTDSTSATNSTTVTASFSSLESTVTQVKLSNDNLTWTTVSDYTAGSATHDATWTMSSGDGSKLVYARITKGSSVYKITDSITLDTTPPGAPTSLTLTANSGQTGFTATLTSPSDTDVSKLYWRYVSLDGNVVPSYPASYTAGTALGTGLTESVSASTEYSITASSMTQLKTYGVRVWAEDEVGNVSTSYAGASLYLSPPTPRLVITAPNSATSAQAGGSLTLTITAKDATGEVITNYAGPYTLTWTPTGGTATTLVSSSSTGWSSGVNTASVSIGGASAGAGTFLATDNSSASLTNGSLNFTFYPASFTVSVTGASSLTAGKPFSLTVTAKDANDATVTRYSGTAALSVNYSSPTSGTKSLSSTSITAANFSSGVATLSSVTYGDAGQITITAKDTTYVTGVTIQGTSSTLTFNPFSFAISVGTPPGGRTGFYLNEAFSLSVTARDFNGLTTPNYRGTVAFSSTPSGVSLPANYAFTASDSGAHTFSSAASCTVAGSYTVTVTDSTVSTATGTSGSFRAIRATLVIPNISGALGTLTGGCYILNNDTNQIVSSDSSTRVSLSISEAVSNSSAVLNRSSLAVTNGSADFNITDNEAEAVTVTAATNPTMPVQSGTFTFGASEASTFIIEYNFEVTSYSEPMPVTTPEATTTTTTTTSTYDTYYTPPADSTYNQATMYDAAVSTGYESYAMADAGGATSYVAPAYTPTADGSMVAPSYAPTYASSSGMASQPAMMQPAMTATPSGMAYVPPPGMAPAPSDGMAYVPADGGMNYGSMYAPPPGMTGGEGFAPGMFAPPPGMMGGGEGSTAGFMPPPGMMGGKEGGLAFGPMFGPPAGMTGGEGGGEGGMAFGPMYGPPPGMEGGEGGMQFGHMYGPPPGMGEGGEGGMAFGPMFGPPPGMMGEGGFEGGKFEGMMGMYGPPPGMEGGEGFEGMKAMFDMYGPPPGMMEGGPEGGMAFGPMFGPPSGMAEGGEGQGMPAWMMGPPPGMTGGEGFEGGMWMGQEGGFMGPEGGAEEDEQIGTEAAETIVDTAEPQASGDISVEQGDSDVE